MHRSITALGFVRRPSAQSGFVLPLAISTSVVLLLGSASLHTLALHGRLRARQQWLATTQRDQLRSAAMTVIAQASDPAQRCVLAWPSSQWSGVAASCPEADLDRLRQGDVEGASWQLLHWQPTAEGATLQLALNGEVEGSGTGHGGGAAAELRLLRHGEAFRLADGLAALPAPLAADGTAATEAP